MRPDRPVSIAFVITELDPGGAERAFVRLVTGLDRTRFQPTVYCLASRGALASNLVQADIPVVHLNARGAWDVGVTRRLARYLSQLRPQIVQTFLFHANLVGRIAGWWARVPIRIGGIRVAERRRNLYLALDRWTQAFVDLQVCVSEAVRDFSCQTGGLDPQKLCVIPNGVEYSRFAQAAPVDLGQWQLTNEHQVWVTAGRLDPQKGPWLMLDAIRQVHQRHPRFRFLWAGRGPLEAPMQQWIREHQLESVIQLIGWQENIPGLLRAAQGFALTSEWEGMPNVILEAQAAGLPVLSTNAEGVSEVISHGQTGWIAPLGNAEEFAARWSALLDNPDELRRVALAGQQRVQTDFTWERMVERYSQLYDTLWEQKAQHART